MQQQRRARRSLHWPVLLGCAANRGGGLRANEQDLLCLQCHVSQSNLPKSFLPSQLRASHPAFSTVLRYLICHSLQAIFQLHVFATSTFVCHCQPLPLRCNSLCLEVIPHKSYAVRMGVAGSKVLQRSTQQRLFRHLHGGPNCPLIALFSSLDHHQRPSVTLGARLRCWAEVGLTGTRQRWAAEN